MKDKTLQRQFEAQVERYAQAFEQGDLATVSGFYAADAIMLPPNKPALEGPEEIESVFAAMRQRGATQLALELERLEQSGDLILEEGAYTMTFNPPGQGSFADEGKYLLVWKCQPDGEWKIYRHIHNTSIPIETGAMEGAA